MLKPKDFVVAVFCAVHPTLHLSLASFGTCLGISASEVHAGLRSAAASKLLVVEGGGPAPRFIANNESLMEFVEHGIRYVYPAVRGALTRGIPTAHGASPLNRAIRAGETPPVWPHAEGTVRGETFEPLYKNAHVVAKRDAQMYGALALLDAARGGQARERVHAIKLFAKMLDEARSG